jgi:hypothetical protein
MPAAKKKIKKAKPKSKKKIVKKLKKKTVTKSAKRSKKPVKKPRSARKPTASAAKHKIKPKRKKKSGPPPEPTWHLPKEGEVEVGAVEDYLSHLGVILTTLKTPLIVGETITIRGFTTNLDQIVRSIQIEHNAVNQAEIGQAVGFKIDEKVRKHDRVFKKAVTA